MASVVLWAKSRGSVALHLLAPMCPRFLNGFKTRHHFYFKRERRVLLAENSATRAGSNSTKLARADACIVPSRAFMMALP